MLSVLLIGVGIVLAVIFAVPVMGFILRGLAFIVGMMLALPFISIPLVLLAIFFLS